jgi:hypothetical protein
MLTPRNSMLALLIAFAQPVNAEQHHHDTHSMSAVDTRQAVSYPQDMKERTLANMRDHLRTLQAIQMALSKQDYEQAADLAEQRLGMSSLDLHGAHDVAPFMPKGMQDAGTAMHRNASRFSLASRDVTVTGDVKPALAALAEVMGACVACHSGYRMQ